ncbi:MAG: hypothetical protein LBV21_02840, partial [Candidatus Adiutrix sp.]|nr:hypothetical protein [Candidatus Adiutrix sp.]
MPSACRLQLVNESPMGGSMCVFLQDPEAEPGQGHSLAWLGLACGPGRSVQLDWNEDFAFTWAEG